MSIDTSSIMSLVPAIGAVLSLVVFALIMLAYIRKIDRRMERAAQEDWWDEDESSPEGRGGGLSP